MVYVERVGLKRLACYQSGQSSHGFGKGDTSFGAYRSIELRTEQRNLPNKFPMAITVCFCVATNDASFAWKKIDVAAIKAARRG